MKRRTFLQSLSQSHLFTRGLEKRAAVLGTLGLANTAWACRCGVCAQCRPSQTVPAVAFYYGAQIPLAELGAFDWVVLDPDHALKQDPHVVQTLAPQSLVVAYVSLGEVNPSRAYAKDIPPSWVAGQNAAWGSAVIDQAAPGWPQFVSTRMIQPLWDAGFRAFFLDTLDSYQHIANDAMSRQRQVAALQSTLHHLTATFPGIRFLPNRGFELMDPVIAKATMAVAAESLYSGWNAGMGAYFQVQPKDRQWLLDRFADMRTRFQLQGIAIDYVDPARREEARQVAAHIREDGLTPWVADPTLQSLGVGAVELVPRSVLLVHSFAQGNAPRLLNQSAHLYGAMPLEYHGLVPEYRYMGDLTPDAPLRGRYCGVVLWSDTNVIPQTAHDLIRQAKNEGVPVVVMGQAGLDTMGVLGLNGDDTSLAEPVTVERLAGTPAGEMMPLISPNGAFPLDAGAGSQVWMRATSSDGKVMDGAALTSWGGYALGNFAVFNLPGDVGARWSIDPIAFFAQALRLGMDPMPDITTRTGRRAFYVHFDADGFVNVCDRPGSPLSCEVLVTDFLETYRTPILATAVVAEVSDQGIYPKTAEKAQYWARRMFALPHVEVGSHTWAHPFNWVNSELDDSREKVSKDLPYGNYLPMPDYTFNTETEVDGAKDYIQDKLSGPDKPCNIILWPGDCDPPIDALELAYTSGLLNMNGGGATITRSAPTLTRVWPMGIQKGKHFQVYTALSNEETYTNNWTGPYWGFDRVIETYEMTDAPHRLKALHIYFHPYMLVNMAGYTSLKKAFEWTLKQPTHPIYGTQYAKSVLAWRSATVARLPDGGWRLRSNADLRQWRQPKTTPGVDLAQSTGLAGYNVHADMRYLHAAASEVVLRAGQDAQTVPRLVDANADVVAFDPMPGGGWTMRLQGHVPVSAVVALPPGWQLATSDAVKTGSLGDHGGDRHVSLSSADTQVQLRVRAVAV